MTGRLLTAREVGALIGLSTETVLRRWRAGEIPGYRLSSNVLRFDPQAIEAWLEECKRPGRDWTSSVGGRTVEFKRE